MNKSLPDKWVRKAISAVLNDVEVDSMLIPCYDLEVTRGPNADAPTHYILMTSQSNEVDKLSKCDHLWESNIILDIVTRFPGQGNPGSRVLADDILDAARNATKDLQLDVASGLLIVRITQSFPQDINSKSGDENIFRKLMRLELTIK